MSASEAPGWSIGQVALAVDDIDAAVAFYRDTLGVPFIAQPGPNLAFFDSGGVRLMLSSGAGTGGTGCTLYFRVADVDRRCAELQERGVTFDGPPQVIHSAADYELRMAFFRDPAGNLLALMTEHGTYVGQ
ncbi:MAG: VOC family protein [Spirochaetaceae bacterium]|nr:VOC family protein [Spirochaetaceae bacterium]